MTDQELPVLVPLGRAPEGSGTITALGAVILSACGRAAHAASLAPLVAEDLLRHLHLKLHESFKARQRHAWLPGKVYNLLSGSDPDYIEMGGSHLRQTLNLLEVEDRGEIDGFDAFLLRADVARQAHDLLGAQLGVAPDVLRQGLE